jgi:hypothetical protein
MYDPELPNGLQDADIEMAELTAAGNRSARLRRQGICDHGWLKAPVGQPATCNDCGAVFPSAEDAYAARRTVLNGY